MNTAYIRSYLSLYFVIKLNIVVKFAILACICTHFYLYLYSVQQQTSLFKQKAAASLHKYNEWWFSQTSILNISRRVKSVTLYLLESHNLQTHLENTPNITFSIAILELPLLTSHYPCHITDSLRMQNGGCGLAPRPPPTSGRVPPGNPVCRHRQSVGGPACPSLGPDWGVGRCFEIFWLSLTFFLSTFITWL